MSKYGIALAAAGLSLIMAAQASAATTTFSFDGKVSCFDAKECDGSHAGTNVFGSIVFDSADFSVTSNGLGKAAGSANNGFYSVTSDYYGTTTGTDNFNFSLNNGSVSGSPSDSYVINGGAFGVNINLPQGSAFSGNSLSFFQPIGGLLTNRGIGSVSYQPGNLFFYVEHASLTVAAVPEPETYAMLLAGLGVLGAAVKRRNAKQT